MDFILGALGLFDSTVKAIIGIPQLSVFLFVPVVFMLLGLLILLKNAANGSTRR